MTNQEISKINNVAKYGMFICWLGLSYHLGISLFDIPKVDIIQILAALLDEMPVLFNIKGGQPLDPTDFANNGITNN